MEEKFQALVKYIQDIHAKHAEVCKGSCNEQRISYENTMYEEPNPRWVCTFGGYCLGHLPRHCEVIATTFEELDRKVRATIDNAIAEYEKEWQNELEERKND